MDDVLKQNLLRQIREQVRLTQTVAVRNRSEKEFQVLLSNQVVILKVFEALLES